MKIGARVFCQRAFLPISMCRTLHSKNYSISSSSRLLVYRVKPRGYL